MPSRRGSDAETRAQLPAGPLNNPLRPVLYYNLLDKFGAVTISNEGEEMTSSYSMEDGKQRLDVVEGGEYYRVNCHYCTDTRKRLWINHRWGLRDVTGSLNLFLAVCYNENCLATPGNSRLLYQHVFSEFANEDDVLLKNHKAETAPREAVMPGRMVPIDQMYPNHPAHIYVTSRGFDPVVLARDFKVTYCLDASDEFRPAQGRIIIPTYMEGELKGWQARYVGDVPNKSIHKYYNMTGMKKSKLLYNYDMAVQHPFAVICEGPTDVWSFGPEAIALFGKTASNFQLGFMHKWPKLYIVLDGEAVQEADELEAALSTTAEIHRIRLPGHSDPGSIPTATLRHMVLGNL